MCIGNRDELALMVKGGAVHRVGTIDRYKYLFVEMQCMYAVMYICICLYCNLFDCLALSYLSPWI